MQPPPAAHNPCTMSISAGSWTPSSSARVAAGATRRSQPSPSSPPHYANANSIAANREGFTRVLRQKLARIMFVKRRVLKQQGTADCGSPTVKHTRYKILLRRRLTLRVRRPGVIRETQVLRQRFHAQRAGRLTPVIDPGSKPGTTDSRRL